MRKTVELLVSIEVEGDEEPARDFPRRAISAVRDAVKVGRARHPDLTMTVHKIIEQPSAQPTKDATP